jgi:hypothetical protein
MRILAAIALVIGLSNVCYSEESAANRWFPDVKLPDSDPDFELVRVRIVVRLQGTLKVDKSEEPEMLTVEGRAPRVIEVTRYFIATEKDRYLITPGAIAEKLEEFANQEVILAGEVKEGLPLNTGKLDPHAKKGSFHLEAIQVRPKG